MFVDHPPTRNFIRSLAEIEKSQIYSASQRRAILRLAVALSRPLTLGILGEAGVGKSTLMNFLVGERIVPPGGLGRLRPIIRVRHGEEHAAFSIKPDRSRHRLTSKAFDQASAGQPAFTGDHSKVIYRSRELQISARENQAKHAIHCVELHSPAVILKHLEFIEFPAAFNSSALEHAKWRIFRRLDIALWATPASQALKRSELQNWLELRLAPKESSIIVATQIDGLAGLRDKEKLMTRIAKEGGDYFSRKVLVSAKQAMDIQMKEQSPASAALFETGLPSLQSVIEELVSVIRRTRLDRAFATFNRLKSESAG